MDSSTPNIAVLATGGGSPLGTTAKSSTPPEDLIRASRAERYEALSTARKWIGIKSRKLRPDLAFPGDFMRTHDCRYIRKEGTVGVHLQGSTAHYSGLVTCGSVWACPVCAVKIQERRRQELDHLVQWANGQGYQCIMVTFTFPHKSFHTLSDLIARQREAFKRFRAGSPFSKLKKAIGFQGMVRSLEVTHGSNGWHPHTHELWLVKDVPHDLHNRLVRLWSRACAVSGLLDTGDASAFHAFQIRSVDIREDCSSADYLAKQDGSRAWGITHEVAKAKSKSGRAKGVHPHEFLIRNAPGDDDLYFEYVEAMKGSRQLFWSPGLKDRCGLSDLDDVDLAVESDELDDQLGRIDQDEWEFIRRKRLRSQVLDRAERLGWKGIIGLLHQAGFVRPALPDRSAHDLGDQWLILPSTVRPAFPPDQF